MKKLILSLLVLTSLPLASEARYTAYAISNHDDTFGAYGFAVNYRTKKSAVNTAVNVMPGYAPYSYRWWTRKRYTAVARGFTYDGNGYSIGSSRGYRTRSGAVNGAISATTSTRRYSMSWHSGYNH